jgi:hypothetical protein
MIWKYLKTESVVDIHVGDKSLHSAMSVVALNYIRSVRYSDRLRELFEFRFEYGFNLLM